MNIFYIHNDPKVCAKAMTDKHCVKMILESAQMLSTAHHELDQDKAPDNIYKSTHKNHPSAKWVRQSVQNYKWLYDHFIFLSDEYTRRYNRRHKTDKDLSHILINPPKNIPVADFTQPPQAMPDIYKTNNSVRSYRIYYITEKLHNDKDSKRFYRVLNKYS